MIYQIEFLMFGGSSVIERINMEADSLEPVKQHVAEMIKSHRATRKPDLLRPPPDVAYQIRENGGPIVFQGSL